MGRPVPPWVFCGPPARGSLVLAVTFAFPGESANCLAHAPDHTPMSTFLGAGRIFCKALSAGHLSGACGPLPLIFPFQAVAPVQAWSLGLVNWCGDGVGCPHTGGSLLFCCTVCVHWGVCNYYAHAPVIPLMSTFLHVRSVLCNTCAAASIRGLRSPALGCVHWAVAPVHALSSYR